LPSEHGRQDWVGYVEAQRFSGLGRRTLRRLISNGQLRAAKFGEVIRIEKHSLQQYMYDHNIAEQLQLFD